MIDWSEFRSWAQLAFTIGLAVWTWSATRHRAHVSELRVLKEDVQTSKERLALVERDVTSIAPARSELGELTSDMRVVSERLAGFAREFEMWRTVTREQLNRIDSYLQRSDR